MCQGIVQIVIITKVNLTRLAFFHEKGDMYGTASREFRRTKEKTVFICSTISHLRAHHE